MMKMTYTALNHISNPYKPKDHSLCKYLYSTNALYCDLLFSFQLVNGLVTNTCKKHKEKASPESTKATFIFDLSTKKSQKQDAHGPHRSPEKTVQINKHI